MPSGRPLHRSLRILGAAVAAAALLGGSLDGPGAASVRASAVSAHAASTSRPTEGATGLAPAAAPTGRVGGYGTPTIDGVDSPGEWANADTIPLSIPGAQGESDLRPVAGTLYVMNDGTNAYVALRVQGVYARLDLQLTFDRNHDHRRAVGDDVLTLSVAGTDTAPRPLALRDQYLKCAVISVSCPVDDTTAGGRHDGTAAGGFDNSSAFVELSHPLASGDRAHDMQAAPGTVLGLFASLKLATGVAQGCPRSTCHRALAWDAGDVVFATRQAAFSTPAEMASALRVEDVRVSPASALPGTTFSVTYRVVNRGPGPLVVPTDGATGRYLGALLTETAENVDDPGPIGARTPMQPASSNQIARRGADVVAGLGGNLWPVGAAVTMSTTSLQTSGFAPGTYRYDVALSPVSGGAAVQTVPVRFTLAAVTAEWSAKVGSSGRYGAGTLRALSTAEGMLILGLRGLPRRRTYSATIVRASCAAPRAVASAGSVATSSAGAVSRSLALSSSKVAAIRAASSSALYLRLVSGSSVLCSRLVSVPLYAGRIHWDVSTPEPIPNVTSNGQPSLLSGIATLGARLLVSGSRGNRDDPRNVSTMVWSTIDGTHWTGTVLASPGREATVASDGSVAVAVSLSGTWRSADGVAWSAAADPPAIPSGWMTPRVLGLPGGGFIAVASPSTSGCAAWTSGDGDTWMRVAATGLAACSALAVRGATIVASGGGWIGRSVDGGRSWIRTLSSTTLGFWSVSAAGDRFVAVGQRWIRGGFTAETWVSVDGRTWTRSGPVPQRPGQLGTSIDSVARFGPGYVGVGSTSVGATDAWAEVLVSPDARTWRLAPTLPDWVGATLTQAIPWGDRLAVIGQFTAGMSGESDYGSVWIGRLLP